MEHDITHELAAASMKYIRTDMEGLGVNFIFLGFHLRENYDRGYYRHVPLPGGDGFYHNFYQCMSDYFGLSRSTISRLVNINRRFCSGTMHLDDQWKNYSFSQLSEILALKDTDSPIPVSSEMTVKEIRDIKRLHSHPLPIQDSLESSPLKPPGSREPLPLCDVAQREKKEDSPSTWYLYRFFRHV